MNKTYRIANRFRFTLFVVLAIIIVTTAFNFAIRIQYCGQLDENRIYRCAGTQRRYLWSVAETYMPEEMDTREAVYELCKINDISAAELYAGMTIQVPIYH